MKPLTPREREVAVLIGEGWDTKAICGQLYIGTRTYETHVERIGDKLGHVPGAGYVLRVMIARWAWQHTPKHWEANT